MKPAFSRVRMGLMIAALLLIVRVPLALAAPDAYVVNQCNAITSCTGNGTVSVIDTATNAVVATVPVGYSPDGMAVSPDGSRVYVVNTCGASSSCTGNGTVSVIDTATNAVIATVPVGYSPFGVAVSPDSSRVYVANLCGTSGNCSGDGTVSVIDTATDTVVATVPAGASPYGVAVSPDGKRVYVTNSNGAAINPGVTVIDTVNDTVVATMTFPYYPGGVAVSPSGNRVYVAIESYNPVVLVIGTATNTVIGSINLGTNFSRNVAVSPDGSEAYAVNTSRDSVSVIDTANNTVVAAVPVGASPFAVAVSPDGSRVYVSNACGPSSSCTGNGTVSVIDTATNTVVATIPVGSFPTGLGAFVGPGALIAKDSSASGGAGTQVNGTVPALGNTTSCVTTDVTVQGPNHGHVTLDANTGAYTYTPSSSSYSGPDSFTWLGQAAPICSAAYNPSLPVSNTATVSLTIDPLLTGLGSVTLGEGKSATEAFSLTGSAPFTHTLASDNATVLPPAGLTISPAACGTAGNLNCTLGLTAASAAGTASVSVTASDQYGDTVKKTILVTVDDAPVANNGTLSTNTNAAASATLSATDPDSGQTLTYSIVTQPAHGTVTITNASTGAYAYTPSSGYAGADSFTFKANDGLRNSNIATVSVTVNDTAPTASNATLSTKTNTAATGTLSATDPDSGQTLTYSILAQPAHGTVTITNAATGAYTYTPSSGYAGSDSFTFKVNDGYKDSNTATVSVSVNDTAPTASNGSVSTSTDAAVSAALSATDPNAGQTLTYALVTQPAHGTVTITNAATGAFTYMPATGYAGKDSFTFKVNDGYKDSNTATVSVSVNDTAPTALNGNVSTRTGTPVNGALSASNPDNGQALTYAIVSQPSHGTVTITDASLGTFTYTPAPGYAGSDSFTFKVNDGYLDSNTAVMAITVADTMPTALSASYQTLTGQAFSGQLQGSAGSAGQTLTFALGQAPAHGKVTLNANGSFSYTPNPGFAGNDAFTFVVNDGYLNSAPAAVSVVVNDGVPTASNASFSTPVDTSYTGQLQASDPNTGQTLTYSIVSQPAHGKVTITDASTGAYTYTPNNGYTGSDIFTFKANDGYQDSNIATVSATVTETAPVAKSASYDVTINTAYSGQLQATASSSSSALTYAIVTQPAHGTLSLDAGTGAFVYIPNHDYVGTDSFTFTASDGSLTSNAATVSLTVAAPTSGSSGGGAFGPWGLALLLALALLIAWGRKARRARSSDRDSALDSK